MGKDNVYPDKAIMTTAGKHDRNQLEVLVDDKEAMYVFDCGYVDYKRFDRMTDDGLFFVSRLKKNAVTRVIHSFELPDDTSVIRDEMVYIGTPHNRAENVFRLVEINDTKGNVLPLIINQFGLSTDEISNIYRSRWAIELFFKWLKQHVEIKHFYGMTENALQSQIYIALITYCLHVLIRLEADSKKSLLRISRGLKRPYESQLIFVYDGLNEKLKPNSITLVAVTPSLSVYFYQMDSATFCWSLIFLAHLGICYLHNIQTTFMQR